MQVLQRLLSLPLVAGVSEPDLDALLQVAPPVAVDAETLLMNAGDVGDDIVLVLDGGFAVELGEGSATLPLAFVGPGEILGEAALFRRGAARSARVRAVQPSVVLRLDAGVLDHLARQGNGVPRAIEEAVMRTMARRIHDSVQAIDGVLASALDTEEPKGALQRLRELFRR
ncbi:cyclic nucleotide-binding domain-containing protein [Myxococcota bacterium]|nr:cyclic nucleotide-binding domain-containing protein [Myxococcota bacterium]